MKTLEIKLKTIDDYGVAVIITDETSESNFILPQRKWQALVDFIIKEAQDAKTTSKTTQEWYDTFPEDIRAKLMAARSKYKINSDDEKYDNWMDSIALGFDWNKTENPGSWLQVITEIGKTIYK